MCKAVLNKALFITHVYTHKIARLVWGKDLTMQLIPSPKQWLLVLG